MIISSQFRWLPWAIPSEAVSAGLHWWWVSWKRFSNLLTFVSNDGKYHCHGLRLRWALGEKMNHRTTRIRIKWTNSPMEKQTRAWEKMEILSMGSCTIDGFHWRLKGGRKYSFMFHFSLFFPMQTRIHHPNPKQELSVEWSFQPRAHKLWALPSPVRV